MGELASYLVEEAYDEAGTWMVVDETVATGKETVQAWGEIRADLTCMPRRWRSICLSPRTTRRFQRLHGRWLVLSPI
ncbi:hypothetical protein Misp02_35460 [Microtetraspora sp. NBRC 16547]|nr:hypothetical protein Misp02_35460 [Microtetraspora sp. NBRC 16547]